MLFQVPDGQLPRTVAGALQVHESALQLFNRWFAIVRRGLCSSDSATKARQAMQRIAVGI